MNGDDGANEVAKQKGGNLCSLKALYLQVYVSALQFL